MRTHDWLRWFIPTGLTVFEWTLVLGIFFISAQQVRSGNPELAIMTSLIGVVFSVIAFNLYTSRPRHPQR